MKKKWAEVRKKVGLHDWMLVITFWIAFVVITKKEYESVWWGSVFYSSAYDIQIDVVLSPAIWLSAIASFLMLSTIFMLWKEGTQHRIHLIYVNCCWLLLCVLAPQLIDQFTVQNGNALANDYFRNPAIYPLFFGIAVFMIATEFTWKRKKEEDVDARIEG